MRKKIKLSEKLMEKHGNIRVNLEMQVLDEGNWNERGVYYLSLIHISEPTRPY